jgi:hypothetical protein
LNAGRREDIPNGGRRKEEDPMNEWIWEILPYVVLIVFVMIMVIGSYLRFTVISHDNHKS